MEKKEDVIGYVASKMNISRIRAAGFLGMANDAVEEVLDREHIPDYSRNEEAILECEEDKVNLQVIADTLGLPVTAFSSHIEDEMVWIQFGENITEGIAAEGPSAIAATASFYGRWYDFILNKHEPILLSDGQPHYYNENGEEKQS
jgi:hypothetical protein